MKSLSIQMTRTDNKRLKNKSIIIYLLIAVFCVLLSAFVSLKFYRVMLLQGNSMLPTYCNMQFTVLDVHSKDYTYGDVIAFKSDPVKTAVVKRIAALPGDSVVITDGVLYVNKKESAVYPEKYIFEFSGVAENEIILKENEYFVIGDNIAESKDSRYREIGLVKENNIIGEIIL